MRILGIETSCDETASAVVTSQGRVLSSVVSSQVKLHGPMGGVVPEIASRAHVRSILPVIRAALSEASIDLGGIDGIAVTRGPGLIGALLVGVQTAKALAWSSRKPVVGVHHLMGHMMAPMLRIEGKPCPKRPWVALVASGGHTSLYAVSDGSGVVVLGQTRDDAAGEALDKGAKLLGLGYPGGPAIEAESALHAGNDARPFPRGLNRRGVLDFSFSGLKTALAVRVGALGEGLDSVTRRALCRAYEEAVVDSLVTKSLAACLESRILRLVVSGGVAANSRLRRTLEERTGRAGIELFLPPPEYCTDNAAMIALAGAPMLDRGENHVMDLAAAAYMPVPSGLPTCG